MSDKQTTFPTDVEAEVRTIQEVRKKYIKNREMHMKEAIDREKDKFNSISHEEKYFFDKSLRTDYGGSIWNEERMKLLHILSELSEILGAYDGVQAPREKGTDHTGTSIVFKWHEAKGPKFARFEKQVYVKLHYNDTYGPRMDVENLYEPSEITTYTLSGFCRHHEIPFYLAGGYDSMDLKESFANEHDTHDL